MNKKMNNKGFSLVELIIVIAIMAVLVGVLAPQFMKYVERGRKSTDAQSVSEIITAVQVYVSDPMVATANKAASGSITLTTTSTAVTSTNATNNLDKALTDAGLDKIGLKSSDWTSGGTVKINVTVNGDGTVDFAIDSTTAMKSGYDILNGVYQ